MWKNEKQRQNTYEIAKEAGALYDNISRFNKRSEYNGYKA
jgi:DNA anti-recombination protein RmuC